MYLGRIEQIALDVKEATGKYMMCMNSVGNDLVYMMLQAEGVSQFKTASRTSQITRRCTGC